MNRDQMLSRVFDGDDVGDILVIGGGATGLGVAVDAASRGYRTALVEQHDFGKGTSSRSTKLAHGGVRYLQQGNLSLVTEALHERGIMRRNAPHLVHDLKFIVPNYDWWEAPFYGIGLKVYDMLAGKYGFGRSRLLSKDEVLQHIPALQDDGLRGGVLYYDGQFDDARLLINLAQTAVEHGAAVLNYVRVVSLHKDGAGLVSGAVVRDVEGGREKLIKARCVINATGAFCDNVRQMDEPDAPKLISPSQGAHIVLARKFLGGDAAIMVPRTSDKRVMFAIPWHDHVLVGTTDTPVEDATLEPMAMSEEVDFLLETAHDYLEHSPGRADVLSVFAGIRPLVKAGSGANTAALSREHVITVSQSGLLTIAGGKWTTYRRMAEECVDHAAAVGQLKERPCTTESLNIHGYDETEQHGALSMYGSDAPAIRQLMEDDPALARPLHETLPIVGAQVVWAARHEMARSVEDVLSRRTRALLLDARAAIGMAEVTATILARELGRNEAWRCEQVDQFRRLARGYVVE